MLILVQLSLMKLIIAQYCQSRPQKEGYPSLLCEILMLELKLDPFIIENVKIVVEFLKIQS